MGLVVVGDIHGCARSLDDLLAAINPGANDHIVFVGDYIDRGPDSKGVIDRLLALRESVSCTFLRGNHEKLFLDYLDKDEYELFAINGGITTLESYRDEDGVISIPKAHIDFVRETELWYETEDEVIVHAGLDPALSIAENLERADPEVLLWERSHLKRPTLNWEKTVICGHTPVPKPVNKRNLINIDTGCVFHGNSALGTLTAVRLPQRTFLSVPYSG